MNKIKIFLLVQLLSMFSLKAQNEVLNFNWVTALVPVDRYLESKALIVTTDSAKNVYTFGLREGDFNYSTPLSDSLISSSNPKQYFLSKQDKYGSIVWYKHFSIAVVQSTIEVKEMATDNNGGLYLVGNYKGVVDFNFDPNVTDTIRSIDYTYDFFSCKYDVNANLIYCKTFGSPYNDYTYSACFDKNMNSYIVGRFFDECDFDPSPQTYTFSPDSFGYGTVFLSKYDSFGNLVFAQPVAKRKNFNGFIELNKLTYNSSRDILNLTATFRDSIMFNFSNSPSSLHSSSYAACIFMYSLSGDLLFFKKTVSGFWQPKMLNICASDSNKNLYTLYNFDSWDTLSFCGQNLILNKPLARYSNLLVKTDSMGNCIWSHVIGRENKTHVVTKDFYVDKEGNSILHGLYHDTVSFNKSNNGNYLYGQYYVSNTFIAKYNSDDSLLFVNSLIDGNSQNIYAAPNYLHVNRNDIYVIGTYSPPSEPYNYVDFDISANSIMKSFTPLSDNGYIVKYNICNAGSVFATSNPSLVCIGDNSSLSYSTMPSTNSYTWSNSCTLPTCAVSPTVNTTYKISSTFSNGCIGTYPVDVFVKNCVGEREYELNGKYFDIYPNPANKTIEVSSDKDADLVIISSIGQVLKSFSVKKQIVQTVNVDDLESGIYYIIPKENIGGYSRKLIVIK